MRDHYSETAMRQNRVKLLGVIPDAVLWPNFDLLAKQITDTAHQLGHYVIFLNANDHDKPLQQVLNRGHADCYLISRRLINRSHKKNCPLLIEKPYAVMDDHLCVVSDGLHIPPYFQGQIIKQVKYVFL